MFDNPFSPVFGGRPGVFFGRQAVLGRFSQALATQGSHYRTMFVTGSRGSGKTALLEQMSLTACSAGYQVVDAVYSNALGKLYRAVGGIDESSVEEGVQLGVSGGGIGASVKLGASSASVRYGAEDLDDFIVRSCEATGHGILLTIDEVQKIAKQDLEHICNAYQMASRKGAPVMLVVAGLPGSFQTVSEYEGCTYMRRAHLEEIGLFTPQDAYDAIAESVGGIDQLSIAPDVARRAAAYTKGQPYLMQLICYHLIEHLNRTVYSARHQIGLQTYEITDDDVDAAFGYAIADYRQGALQPILDELPAGERYYLAAMAQVLGPDRTAPTGLVAQMLGKEPTAVSSVRQRLLRRELIAAPWRGSVMFAIPYLAEYLASAAQEKESVRLLQDWGV